VKQPRVLEGEEVRQKGGGINHGSARLSRAVSRSEKKHDNLRHCGGKMRRFGQDPAGRRAPANTREIKPQRAIPTELKGAGVKSTEILGIRLLSRGSVDIGLNDDASMLI
jgi:hypothetical protein